MSIPRTPFRVSPLGRAGWGLVLALAVAPGPVAATADGVVDGAVVAAAGEPAPGAAAEPAPAPPAEPAPAPPAEPAPAPPAEPAPPPAAEPGPAAPSGAASEPPASPANPLSLTPGELEFNLLGPEGAPPLKVNEEDLRLRRKMLNVHQALGFGVIALDIGTTIYGQLNYNDKFYGSNTGKYREPHAILAYSTLAVFAAAGLVAVLAPSSPKKHEGADRVTVHKIAMATATAGMIAQGFLGVYVHEREGYMNQKDLATTHLVIGYATLAAILVGFGAIAF